MLFLLSQNTALSKFMYQWFDQIFLNYKGTHQDRLQEVSSADVDDNGSLPVARTVTGTGCPLRHNTQSHSVPETVLSSLPFPSQDHPGCWLSDVYKNCYNTHRLDQLCVTFNSLTHCRPNCERTARPARLTSKCGLFNLVASLLILLGLL